MKKIYLLPVGNTRFLLLPFLLCLQLMSTAQESMRANLYVMAADGSSTLMDGNFTNYQDIYSDSVDWDDAWKMTNLGENFGIYRQNITLVVERRSLIENKDTSYFRMWNLQPRNYRLQFITQHLQHPGLQAFLKDNYLNTLSAVNLDGTTTYDFTVNTNAASYNPFRFQLLYSNSTSGIIPVGITGIRASRKGSSVSISWTVENEVSMEKYEVEHGTDGLHFLPAGQIQALNDATGREYSFTDPSVGQGIQFYRVKATGQNGAITYSTIAKLAALAVTPYISVYPNPVANKTAWLQTNNLQAGYYDIALIAINGLSQRLTGLAIAAGQSSYSITLPPGTRPGIYRIRVTAKTGESFIQPISVL